MVEDFLFLDYVDSILYTRIEPPFIKIRLFLCRVSGERKRVKDSTREKA